LITLFAVLVIHGGCVYIPIPAIDLQSQKGVVPDEAIKSLRQGKSNRADVLLLLGDPDERREQDRFFIYTWIVEVIWDLTDFGPDPWLRLHYYCVEFNETNEIKRHAHLGAHWLKDVHDEMRRWFKESED